jgi:Flp pilus assembly protein TadD
MMELDGSIDSGTVTGVEAGAGTKCGGWSDPETMNEAYERFTEGQALLSEENARAAVEALERARDLEPEQGSIRETLARAYFRSGRFIDAEVEFAKALEIDPVNDYAHFGIALCRLRAGDRALARGHLKLATIMRPDSEAYRDALARVTE